MGVSNRSEPYVFSHKVAPGVDVGNLVCATDAVHARFRSDASSIVKLNFTSALQRVLQCKVEVHGCRSHCNGCIHVVDGCFGGCSCIVICKAMSANCIVVAASKFLGATAACVILLCFAAEHRKSYWNGCMKVAIVILQ